MSIDTELPAGNGDPVPTEPLQAASLDASLAVRDLPKCVAWYRDVLGFTVDTDHRREDELIAVSL